jgi:hypothetical protein
MTMSKSGKELGVKDSRNLQYLALKVNRILVGHRRSGGGIRDAEKARRAAPSYP